MGKIKSKNMYKGPMGKDMYGGWIECGRWKMGRAGEINEGKWGQL